MPVLMFLSRLLKPIATLALWLAGIGVVAMTVAVAWQVFGRYVMNDTPTWTEPAVLLLMSWFILLGSAVGVRERDHIGFEVGLAHAPPALRFAMRLVVEVLVLGFGAAMLVYGWQLAAGTWGANLPLLGVPQGMSYVPVAVGGALIILFAIEKIVEILIDRGRTPPDPAGASEA
jgi:TRAP-type C4-dicarboxylate transport system permease small subunit